MNIRLLFTISTLTKTEQQLDKKYLDTGNFRTRVKLFWYKEINSYRNKQKFVICSKMLLWLKKSSKKIDEWLIFNKSAYLDNFTICFHQHTFLLLCVLEACIIIVISLTIIVTSWWARWHLKSPASRLFTQPFTQAHIKENIKVPGH